MRRIVYLYITREDFLKIKSLGEGGTVIDGRRYAQLLDPEKQLAEIGQPDKTGEGIITKVYFFEYIENDPSDVIGVSLDFNLRVVSGEIVDHYETEQELQKELALIKAKINLNNIGE